MPISVTRRDGVCTIHAGRAGAHGDVLSTQWISEAQAIAVTREARRYAGDRPDGPTAADALARAAASQRATLTADHVAIERAGGRRRRSSSTSQRSGRPAACANSIGSIPLGVTRRALPAMGS